MPGRYPAVVTRSGQLFEAGGERRGRGQPVADGRLVAVVHLEHLEGPSARQFEVGQHVGLRDVVEVVVPGAPADLVVGASPRRGGGADDASPVGQQHLDIGHRSGLDHDGVKLSGLSGLHRDAPQKRLSPEQDVVAT